MTPGQTLRTMSGVGLGGTVVLAVVPRTLPSIEPAGDPSRPVVEVTTFGLRLVACGLAGYVTVVLVALLLVSLRLLPSTLGRTVDRWTTSGLAGAIRRLVGASVLVLGVLPLQPLAAQAEPTPPVLAPTDRPQRPTSEAPRLDPLPPVTPIVPRPREPQPAQEPAPGPAQTHTVEVGDSFWSIAEDQVAIRLGRTPTDTEVVEPWLALIAANRDRLLDPGDPDLLHPGQVLRLPDP